MKKTIFLFALSLSLGFATSAQVSTTSNAETGRVGNMKVEKFIKLNAKGTEMVMAITPSSTTLTAADKALLLRVATGGQKQLAISEAALTKITDPQAKILAQSEVEEQTTIAAKLTQIASAKGVTLPTGPDATAQALVSRFNSASGAAVDALYISESGIKGHQELEATMSAVKNTATDQSLKALAKATLPVIKAHLKTSQQVQASMNGAGSSTTTSGK